MLRSSLPVVFLTYALIIHSSLNRIDEFLLFRELKYLFSNWMGKPRQLLYRGHLLAYYSLLDSNIFELQSSIGCQSDLTRYTEPFQGASYLLFAFVKRLNES